MNREVHVRFWESAGLQCLAPLAYLRAYASVPEHGPPSADVSTPFTMPEGPIRALTGGCRMRPTHCAAANPGCSITMAEIHLAAANRLFKQTEPALSTGNSQY
jgi:hypothetical protein